MLVHVQFDKLFKQLIQLFDLIQFNLESKLIEIYCDLLFFYSLFSQRDYHSLDCSFKSIITELSSNFAVSKININNIAISLIFLQNFYRDLYFLYSI